MGRFPFQLIQSAVFFSIPCPLSQSQNFLLHFSLFAWCKYSLRLNPSTKVSVTDPRETRASLRGLNFVAVLCWRDLLLELEVEAETLLWIVTELLSYI